MIPNVEVLKQSAPSKDFISLKFSDSMQYEKCLGKALSGKRKRRKGEGGGTYLRAAGRIRAEPIGRHLCSRNAIPNQLSTQINHK